VASKTMKVENPAALTDVLRRLETVAAESTLRKAAVAGARTIYREVKMRAPIGPHEHVRAGKTYPAGTLRRAILIAYDKEDSLTGVRATYLVGVGKDAFYARFIEFGTSRQAAQPFIRPGYDARRAAAASAIGIVLEREIAKAIK
jgi:HK97 gp10 family phage protein